MKYILPIIVIVSLIFHACSELEDNINEPQGEVRVHPEGILNPASPNFHGKLIKNSNWNMNQCKSCHGTDFHGGTIDVSCTNCHSGFAGPENCSTCHGSETSPAPPADLEGNILNTYRGVGAHQPHLASNLLGKSVSCAECHVVPANVYSPGHLDSVNHAEVIMNNFLANVVTNDPSTTEPFLYDPLLPVFTPDPSYDSLNQSCSNTYCHGSFKNGNLDNTPTWVKTDPLLCGSCHGDPDKPNLNERARPKSAEEGGTHPGGVECYLCHGGVVDQNLRFINVSKHIDGKVNLFGIDYRF